MAKRVVARTESHPRKGGGDNIRQENGQVSELGGQHCR